MGARTSLIYSPPPVYSHPFNERTGHSFPPRHRNRLCDHNSESAFRDGRLGASFAEFRSGAEIPLLSVCTSTPIVVPLGRTRIFVRPAIGTAREAPIRNRHFDPVGTRSNSEISGARRPLIASGDKTSFRARKTFDSHSELAISADDLPDSKVFWQ
ncbi:hypothetical protein Taro_015392 [Colocasia esculenta]|uniref:Uncharacterized protein n=1 Tax=Colocasia esculenta TaxID=4460 RepID=A0A843USZ7_COLES|nr:hypothetical protein [Colocasia esculenta]